MTVTPPDPNQPFGAGQTPYPGAQPPAAPYGGYPTGPAGAPRQAPPAPPQPSSIALAVKLMWAGAALSLVSLVYTLSRLGGLKDDIRAKLIKNGTDATKATVDVAFGVAIGFAVMFGLVGALLWLWMAWKNGQGRGWARVVATVFAGLNLVGLLFSLAGGTAEPLALVLTVLTVGIGVVVVILLWRKESSAFYEGTAASRRLY
ncbi:MAG: hypothetical protein ABWX74_18290 [Aeromicrobium sp.]